MKHLFLATMLALIPIGAVMAQGPSCESKAVAKDGKPLTGAAKASFVTKCKSDACDAKAVGKDGKALAGAAKKSFLDKCKAGA